jgi:hypothetical protein
MKATKVQANAKAETVTMLTCERVAYKGQTEQELQAKPSGRTATTEQMERLMHYWDNKRH